MIIREAAVIIEQKIKQYPVIAVTGPRQAGKSTLVKFLFPNKPYVSLEDLDHRQFASSDPRSFLSQFPDGAIFDEVQHCPDLFSYIQTRVDAQNKQGLFVLTGSQQFGLFAKISQSLAGRVGFIQLLPFTLGELQAANCAPSSIEDLLLKGMYPPVYDRNIPASSWYSDYILTYLQRDVRQLLNVHDLRTFHSFLQMCAARTGQLLNLSSLASDCGITHNTAKSWISILEASYILHLLPPHHRNFNKRLIKSPKLYFYDTGLVCALLSIQKAEQLKIHPIRGQLFETWAVSELIKHRFNHGLLSNLYFWRDSQGHEMDVIIENGDQLTPIEIKAGQTINADYFSGVTYWRHLDSSDTQSYLVYAGDQTQVRAVCNVVGWRDFNPKKMFDA